MSRKLLPSHVGPYRVEHVTAVLFFLMTVPALLAPVIIRYPTTTICQSTEGCKELKGGLFSWEGVESGNAFRKILTLTTEPGADAAMVANQIVSQANAQLPWYGKVFPIREPRVEMAPAVSKQGKVKKGAKK